MTRHIAMASLLAGASLRAGANLLAGASLFALVAGPALAQGTALQTPHPRAANAQPAAAASAAAAPMDALVLFFDFGSAAIAPSAEPLLDQAARLYRAGQPIVMTITAGTDTAGPAGYNLDLSERRARSVLDALTARGIPVDRFQLLAKGETDPTVPTPADTPDPRDRQVEISWR